MTETSDRYLALRHAIAYLQEAALALADVEIEEIRFKAPAAPMNQFHRILRMETPAIEQSTQPQPPNHLICIDGVNLTRTIRRI